ncbi:nucleotide-diphospho-sugar transferase [Neurospora crassa]|nr:nucleotide-diphospho-sugar transferase [Neurospora crassa]
MGYHHRTSSRLGTLPLAFDLPARVGQILMLQFRRLRRSGRNGRRIKLLLKIALPLLVLYLVDLPIHLYRTRVARPHQDLDQPFAIGCLDPSVTAAQPRENATFVMLARNSEIEGAKATVANIERQFNRWFHYPIMFLNDAPWSEEFKNVLSKAVTNGTEVRFEVIEKGKWGFPEGMNEKEKTKARLQMKKQGERGVGYGDMESYHHMCRFYSGEFYNLEALRPYKWYWRLEPSVRYSCALTYDPFVEMARHNKVYGWTIALWEVGDTCPSLFKTTDDYRIEKDIPRTPTWNALLQVMWFPAPVRWFLGLFRVREHDNSGNKWNMCHYWSNFEIANLDFFRGREYQDYFRYLDSKGGFYSERWGDAPVHTLAVHMLLPPEKIHHFSDIGYEHDTLWQCPGNAPMDQQLLGNKALRDMGRMTLPSEGGTGCRCKCQENKRRRNINSQCTSELTRPVAFHRPSWWERHNGVYHYAVNNPNNPRK